MTDTYPNNTTLLVTATFTDDTGAAFDPPAPAFDVLEPDGTVVTKTFGVDSEVTQVATGVYRLEYPTTKPGEHRVRANDAGVPVNSYEVEFWVKAGF